MLLFLLKRSGFSWRPFRQDDLMDLYAYLSDETVLQFEPYPPLTLADTREELTRRIASREMIAVELKRDHRLIGNIYCGQRDFHALELGYVFNRSDWGCGYARESCAALIDHAFAGGIHRIYAECDPCNTASWHLLERLGFRREAHLVQNIYFHCDAQEKPIWKDTYIYGRLNPRQG